MNKFMTRLEMRSRIRELKDELNNRHRDGLVKMASDGQPIPVENLQNELFDLIYKLSKLEDETT